MFAYLFERFPKFSQTFCYREIAELFRQGERPAIFSLRSADFGPGHDWGEEILARTQYLPEGDVFAADADRSARSLDRAARRLLREWRGRPDSLRLHQAVYVGAKLRNLGVTHLHTHFAGMAARTAFWINRFFGIRFSVTVHANDIFAPRPFEIGLSQILSAAHQIAAVSDFAAGYLRQKFPAADVVRIYNGIDLSAFNPSRFPSPPLLLSVGRLISKKGFDVLIDACAALRSANLDFRAEIFGDGPLRGQLQAQIERLGLQDYVRLVGEKSQSEICQRLAEATVFALLARIDPDGAMDNLPTVIIEAMAASLPVVSTTVAGIPEMVENSVTGRLVLPNDALAVAKEIESILTQPERGRKMGARGRERAAELFAIEKNVAELRKIFR